MNRGSLFLAAALTGCASPGLRYAAPDLASRMTRTAALLPFDNESVNLRGPDILRELVEAGLRSRGWTLADRDAVDETLRRLGVSEGGQLGALDPKRLGAELGVPALIFGTVEEFTYQNLGYVRRRAVRLSLKLVDAGTGERLWEAEGEETSGKVAVKKGAAGRSFIEGLAEQAAETALGVPLAEESRAAVEKVLSYLSTGGL